MQNCNLQSLCSTNAEGRIENNSDGEESQLQATPRGDDAMKPWKGQIRPEVRRRSGRDMTRENMSSPLGKSTRRSVPADRRLDRRRTSYSQASLPSAISSRSFRNLLAIFPVISLAPARCFSPWDRAQAQPFSARPKAMRWPIAQPFSAPKRTLNTAFSNFAPACGPTRLSDPPPVCTNPEHIRTVRNPDAS
jgi:hypothetical protein